MILASRLRRARFGPAILVGGLLTLSCGGEGPSGPPAPVPGTAVVTLNGALSDDRAVLLEIGPGVFSLSTGASGLQVHTLAEGGKYIVAAFGPLAGGEVIRIQIPDIASLPPVVIREVATESGTLRTDLAQYGGRITVIQ